MKRICRVSAFFLILALLLALPCGCKATGATKAGADGRIVLDEPAYVGLRDDGYPVFRFTWSESRKLWYYDMAIYLEMDGYAERSRVSFPDAKQTSAEIPFLKGIGTDTATYRVKVRPLQAENDAWSDVWQIDFVDGAYTVAANAPDFDPPRAEKTPSPDATPAPTKAPAAHAFPEPLLTYAAKEQGVDGIDLSRAVTLTVRINHCLYGEPTQTITDPKIVATAADAISGIIVTGDSDGMASTGTSYGYYFSDADGNGLAGFAFQDDMLMKDDGRYPVTGLEALYAVDGIKLADDWEAYWQEESEKEDAYAETFVPSYPASAFALSGYNASLLETIDPADIHYVTVGVSWNDYAGTLETADPAVIRDVYGALSALRVTGRANEDDPTGQEWTVRFSFSVPGDAFSTPADLSKTAYLSFEGDYLLSDLPDGGETPYVVEGLDAFFACTDAPVLQYLSEHRNTTRPDPSYS